MQGMQGNNGCFLSGRMPADVFCEVPNLVRVTSCPDLQLMASYMGLVDLD